jgi:hypothetical protein
MDSFSFHWIISDTALFSCRVRPPWGDEDACIGQIPTVLYDAASPIEQGISNPLVPLHVFV